MKRNDIKDPAIDLSSSIPIEEHENNIQREGEHLRTALDAAEAIASRSETAAIAEAEAKAKLAQHAALSAETKAIKDDWQKLLADREILKTRLARGRIQSHFIKEHFQKKSEHLKGYWGGLGSNLEFLGAAQQIAQIEITIPFAESAVKHLEKLNADHLSKMVAFGKEHGLPKDVLAGLS